MTRQKLHIAIPEPCHENWDKMTPTEQGRFCDVCSKCVVDFTRFSDNELLAYFSNPPKNLCGRFENRQLNKTIEKVPVYRSWFSFPKKWVIAVGLWLGILAKGTANTPSISPFTSQQTIYSFDFEPQTTSDSTRTIQGVVIDSTTDEPLIGVDILISGTKTGTHTDLEGKFKLQLPKEYFNKEAIIEARYVGYETISHKISTDTSFHVLKMTERPFVMAEEAVVIHMGVPILEPNNYFVGKVVDQELIPLVKEEEIKVIKPTRWQRIKTFFRNLF